MNAAHKDELKRTYPEVAAGRADMYVYFYARALQLLHNGGTLAFISSNKFFRARYGEGLLRVLTQETTTRVVIDFGDAGVFDAATYPCVIVTARSAPAADHTYRGRTVQADIHLDRLDTVVHTTAIPLLQAKGIHPPSGSGEVAELVERIMRIGTPLEKYLGVKSYRGIVPGRQVFIIDQDTRDRLVEADPRSSQILKPYLRGRDLGRYAVRFPNLWLIYTFHGVDIDRYPAVKEYLRPSKSVLEQRVTDQPWYELQQPQMAYQSVFERPKIMSVKFGLHASFAYDEHGFFANNATSFISPGTKWLTAVLNSSVCNICLISICPAVQNGYSQFFNFNIDMLPVAEPALPDKERLEELVDALQAAGGQGPQAEELEREVDAIVYRTYGLTKDEIAEIERWHAERRAMLGGGRRGRAQAAEEEDDAEDDE